MKAAVYSRLSHNPDGTRSETLREQRERGQAIVETEGWDLLDIYEDDDISAYSGDTRPGFEALLQSGAEVVVVRSIDRLARQPYDIERVHAAGMKVWTWEGRRDDFIAKLEGLLGWRDSAEQSKRIKLERTRAASAGKYPYGGKRHLGYTHDGEVIEEEAERIRDAVRRFLAGGISQSQIAREWNDAGFRTTGGNLWRQSTVRRVLLSPRIAGLRVHHGDVIPGEWEPIITREEHERLVGAQPGARQRETHLLSGFVRCGSCGHSMQHKVGRWACGKIVGDPKRCGRVSIEADRTEQEARSRIEWLLVTRGAASVGHAGNRSADQVESLQGRLRDIKQQADELDDTYWEKQAMSRDRYLERSRRLEEQREAVEGELAAAKREARKAQDAYDIAAQDTATKVTLLREGSLAEQRGVIATVVDRVEIAPARPGKYFDPSRITVIAKT